MTRKRMRRKAFMMQQEKNRSDGENFVLVKSKRVNISDDPLYLLTH